MIITIDVSNDELVDLFGKLQTVHGEDIVNAIERVENVARQQLREERRTARATTRSARYGVLMGGSDDDEEIGPEFDDGR